MGLKVNPPPKLNRAMIKTGTYVGNGIDNRNIDIGINLAAKDNVWVIIKSTTTAQWAIYRIEIGQGDLSYFFGNFGNVVDAIQSFTNTGFQLGTHSSVNQDTMNFVYIAIWTEL